MGVDSPIARVPCYPHGRPALIPEEYGVRIGLFPSRQPLIGSEIDELEDVEVGSHVGWVRQSYLHGH